MLQTGYILNRRSDAAWFLGLPFLAIAFALICQQWLPAVALVSVSLWITIPHHFATWVRTYGVAEDWARWKDRLILGPLSICLIAAVGLVYAPLTVAVIAVLWDHQHSVMQQHGLARIYDFKSGAGSPATRHFDMALNWVLYINLFLTAPLFAQVWLNWLYRWQLPLSPSTVEFVQHVSMTCTAAYLCIYAAHVIWCLRTGRTINPIKHLFIFSSFFLWYFTAWHTDSILVAGIAHRLMHGLQYIVIAYWYTRRKVDASATDDRKPGMIARLVRTGNLRYFVLGCAVYAVVYQLIIGSPLSQFGFGVLGADGATTSISDMAFKGFDAQMRYDLWANTIITTTGMAHYYFDSFIWKVSDRRTQGGL